jgi:putative ABC transport system ATP-binding protein
MNKNIISIENITKDYGTVKALDSVTFSLDHGKELAVMGPSGSGKTTLINLIAGLDSPSSGKIIVNGIVLNNRSQEELSLFRRENVGIIFQQFYLIPYLNALENIMLAQYFHSMTDKEEALLALETVGLKERAKHLPSELSGGEQQRVAIARAIINDPDIILADEPTGNLDERATRGVFQLLRDISATGTAVVMATHDLDLVRQTNYRTIELREGAVVHDSDIGAGDDAEGLEP